MRKVDSLFESLVEIGADVPPQMKVQSGSGTKKQQVLIQYQVGENIFMPMGHIRTVKTLPSGIYNIKSSMSGPYYELAEIKTDNLLRFADARYNMILEEIGRFWDIKDNFKDMGFVHKRGLLLYGSPGTGKSCLLKQVMEDVVKKGDIVFISNGSSYQLKEGLSAFREVEPDRQVLSIMEDIDEFDEHTILQLFDGDTLVDNVLFLGTTNYINKLAPRLLREGRFDRKIQIDNPPIEGRVAYFNYKLGKKESKEKIRSMAEKTKGFSFGQLREFLVSVYCLKYDVDETVKRIRNGREEFNLTEEQLDSKLRKFGVINE